MSRAVHRVRTASGIEIGRSYIPPAPRELGSEGEHIQTALLYRPPPLIDRLSDAFERAAPPAMWSIAIAGVALGLAKRLLT